MFCSSCGSAVSQNLSYCNHCGAKVGGGRVGGVNKSAELSPNSLVNAIAAIFVFGLAAFVGLMALTKEGAGFNPVILAAAMLSFALTFLIEAVLIWLLLSGRRRARKAGAAERLSERTTEELGEAQARVLPEPVPSVTEHTTRAFDPIFSERKTK